MHSRTMQDILANVGSLTEVGFYFSHGNPIPDCHNIIVEEALLDNPTHLWLCEDDQAFPYDTLDKLLRADVDVATCDYPVNNQPVIRYDSQGDLLYGGLGCVLIRREVFDKLQRPFFKTDIEYQQEGDELIPRKASLPNPHGGDDVDFWVQVREAGASVKVVGNIGHYKLHSPELPTHGNNSALLYKVEKMEL